MSFNLLERRIIDLSFRHKLSHISSCLNTVNLLDRIYRMKLPKDIVVLANGHAGLALYVVLESLEVCDAEKMIEKHGVHPSRDVENGITVSAGSLGMAETVALGMAIAEPTNTIWLITSDGACAEGSVYEVMRNARRRCPNLLTHVIFNAAGAYGEIQLKEIPENCYMEFVDQTRYPLWLRGLPGHYLTLSQEQYDELMAA